jgi:hypothetical protein
VIQLQKRNSKRSPELTKFFPTLRSVRVSISSEPPKECLKIHFSEDQEGEGLAIFSTCSLARPGVSRVAAVHLPKTETIFGSIFKSPYLMLSTDSQKKLRLIGRLSVLTVMVLALRAVVSPHSAEVVTGPASYPLSETLSLGK